ncbi:nitrilase family protein [Avrilella dinanensis]|uniref:Omega-amidase YafV n=1 Tax=Avrilella dinanensis TaxID=2008672 RepID=A0A2M9R4X7_9FLAO|nr:nitrilase family protein [Avrilella dinanensis]PJR03907.1 nitrilase family protein [Avrilella dinanensis]
MKTALVQFDVIWEDKQVNLAYLTQALNSLADKVDLVVLPEMFSTGFTMNPEKSAEEFTNSKTLQWLQNAAQKHRFAITGSFVVKEQNAYYNRMMFVYPDGNYQIYDKRHLFSLAKEDKHYAAGKNRVIVDYLGWKIALQVCYDLRFPVFSRIQNEDYDMLIYVASWPDKRIDAWDTLLKARAVENMSYVIGVNRCGTDPAGIFYSGHSQAVDYMGNYLIEPYENEGIKIVESEKNNLEKARKKFNFLRDADDFIIIPNP